MFERKLDFYLCDQPLNEPGSHLFQAYLLGCVHRARQVVHGHTNIPKSSLPQQLPQLELVTEIVAVSDFAQDSWPLGLLVT